MQFRLDGFGGSAKRRRTSDTVQREGLPLSVLAGEAAPASLTADVPAGAPRAARLIAYAELLREIARRGGQVEVLVRAAAAAGRARREAGENRSLAAAALYEQAETQRLGYVLFGDAAAASEAEARADEALALAPPSLLAARLTALKARLRISPALSADRAAGIAAAEALELAHKVLAALGAPAEDLAVVAADRAELLIGLGVTHHDRQFLTLAEAELSRLLETLDPDRAPLTWTHVQILRGQALAALGDVAGDAAAIAEGVAALKEAVAALPPNHSPLDQARASHALGLALQAMGEACEEEALFDRAVKAFSPALEALDRTPTLPYRAIVAHDGAVCLTRRAERRGDLKALEQAETAFREALKTRQAAADPLAWAVTQVALARVYEAQAGLRPDTGERADAAFALTSALEVFGEHGMRSLSVAALAALDRVKAPVHGA